jgi:hypothetical protein
LIGTTVSTGRSAVKENNRSQRRIVEENIGEEIK